MIAVLSCVAGGLRMEWTGGCPRAAAPAILSLLAETGAIKIVYEGEILPQEAPYA